MSEAFGRAVLRQIKRVVLLTAGLAPVVAIALVGFTKLRDDSPDWVYWQAALIFLIALKFGYQVTASLCLLGSLIFGFLWLRGQMKGARRRGLARGLLLCIALLSSLLFSELVCAVWISRSHRSTAVPVGSLATAEKAVPHLRFSRPVSQIDLRWDFPDPPGEGEIDIVVVGGSSVQGVPYSRWLSIGKIVAWKLQEAIPKPPIHVHVIARSGDFLETQHKLLRDLKRRPDLVIIYSGHNEFFSRLWWARNVDHYVSDRRPTRWATFVEEVEQFSPLRVLIRESAAKCRIAIPPPADTGRELVDVPAYTVREYTALCTDFRRRLEEISSYAERVGALPVLILPPANDAGFEPNRSHLPPATPRNVRDAFRRDFLAAKKSEAIDPAAAIERYRALIARQPCFAESHYRLGQLLERAGLWDEAYREYAAARDLDGLPMRCPSPFQQVYRDVAARHGWILIDGQAYFHAIGRHGLLDDELFQDAMHPSLRGQIALAQAVLVALRARSAFGWPKNSEVPIVDPAECIAQFGIDTNVWRQIAMWWKGFNELNAPLRYDNSLRMQKREAGIAAAAKIDAGMPPEAVGLPNVGTPTPVPLIEQGTLPRQAASPDIITQCLVE